ncbi:MAG: hypothetical protein KDB18_13185 [Salinibacterium sp.]|nr:hypothetical protein [Salinibacterium sp.]
MNKGMGRLLLLIGTVSYAVVSVLSLLAYVFHAEFLSLVTLGLAVQVAVALPLLAFLFQSQRMPVLPYAKWLVGLVSVLAVAGLLGVPSGSNRISFEEQNIRAAMKSLEADVGELDRLELALDLAKAEGDEDKKAVREKIKDIGKDLSDKDKESAMRERQILEAESAIANFHDAKRGMALYHAEKRNGLLILAAFLILAGAWLMEREPTAAS